MWITQSALQFNDFDIEIDKKSCQNFQNRIELRIKNLIKMRKIARYLKETYDELANKVTWPTAKDLQSSVVVVSIASLIIALVVMLMDWVFSTGMQLAFPLA